MTTPSHISYVKSSEIGLAHQETLTSPLYAAYHYARHIGWVGRNVDGEWIAWNIHGDFWTSYGTSRDRATEALAVAPWMHFSRAAA